MLNASEREDPVGAALDFSAGQGLWFRIRNRICLQLASFGFYSTFLGLLSSVMAIVIAAPPL